MPGMHGDRHNTVGGDPSVAAEKFSGSDVNAGVPQWHPGSS